MAESAALAHEGLVNFTQAVAEPCIARCMEWIVKEMKKARCSEPELRGLPLGSDRRRTPEERRPTRKVRARDLTETNFSPLVSLIYYENDAFRTRCRGERINAA